MKTPPIADEMFPGLLDELVRLTADHTEAHPAGIAAHLLVALGNLVGREAHTYVGETRHGVNEFALIVGETSAGRKGDAKNIAFPFLEAVDEAWSPTSGLSSGEGIIYSVRDQTEGTNRKGETVILDPGIADKRLCIIETEFSQPLKMFRREGNILSNVLRDAWDGKRVLRTLTKTSPVRATEAHVSLIGHTTRDDLRRYLADLDVANGTGNRFLFLAVEKVRDLPSPQRLPDFSRRRLATLLDRVNKHAHRVGYLRRTAAADAVWADIYPTLSRGRPGLLGALLARGPAHVVRLSALFSLLALAPAIDVSHLLTAVAWWQYCVTSAEIVFSDRTGNTDADRIRAEMLPGQALTLEQIRRQMFSGHIAAGRLRDAIDLLGRLGDVRTELRGGDGRSAAVVIRLDPAATVRQAV